MQDDNLTAKAMSVTAHGGARPRAGRPKAPKSEAVRRVREAMGLTQENFAREIGCTTSALTLMERETRLPAKPDVLKKLQALAKRAGVAIEISEEVTP